VALCERRGRLRLSLSLEGEERRGRLLEERSERERWRREKGCLFSREMSYGGDQLGFPRGNTLLF
jgi:hypothetical protein